MYIIYDFFLGTVNKLSMLSLIFLDNSFIFVFGFGIIVITTLYDIVANPSTTVYVTITFLISNVLLM